MALGYEGWAKMNVNGTEDLVLCTGASIPHSRLRLDSNSGYGGAIKTPAAGMGIGFPHNYDFVSFAGSLNFEAHAGVITNQILPWLFDRQKAASVSFQSRKDNISNHVECFWNSINLNTSSGSAVEGSLEFTALDFALAQGGDYIGNKTGDGYLCNAQGGLNIPDPIISNVMIPYWQTSVLADGSLVEFVSWNLDFSQDIVQFFVCENNVNPIAPKFLASGPMTVTFTGDYMFVNTSTWAIPDFLSTLRINIGTTQIKMKRGERDLDRDDVQTSDSPVPISVEYTIYELEP